MSQYFYFNEGDGQKVEGPFPTEGFPDLLEKGIVGPETHICLAGTESWQLLKLIPELALVSQNKISQAPPPNIEEQTQVDSEAIKEAGSDVLPKATVIETEGEEEDDEEEEDVAPSKKKGRKAQKIKVIRDELDRLWEAQRDSIISRIIDCPIKEESIITRKRSKEAFNHIKYHALAYWRKKRTFEKWIEKITKEETSRRLRGTNSQEKYDDIKEWLTKAKLWNDAGTYAFIREGTYHYVGKAATALAVRLTDHFKNTLFFHEATHLRIIIPQRRKWVDKVERLLLLAYEPEKNSMPGEQKDNDADNRLNFILEEIDQLVNDTPLPPK